MDKKRNRLVAVKLFQRPLAHALRDSTVKEITVRSRTPQDQVLSGMATDITLCRGSLHAWQPNVQWRGLLSGLIA